MKEYTTKEVAALYGCTLSRVHTIARNRGIVGDKRSTPEGTKTFWTAKQVRNLKPGKRGVYRVAKR